MRTDNYVDAPDRVLLQANAFIVFLTKSFFRVSLRCTSSDTFGRRDNANNITCELSGDDC